MRRFVFWCALIPLLTFTACEEESAQTETGDPTLTILTPTDLEGLYGDVAVEVFGHDYAGHPLDRIVYYIDDQAVYTDPDPEATSPSSSYAWDTEVYQDGDHDLRVVGYDSDGRSAAHEVEATTNNSDAASGVVRTNTSGVIRTRYGAQIVVPLGAVPLGEEGNNATMVFSIERDTSANAVPPAGQARVSNYYRFTPGGFVFFYPVQVSVPILDDANVEGREVILYRINPTSGMLENFAGSINEEEGTVSAQTYELSTWFAAVVTSGSDPQGFGCIEVNNVSGDWLSMCVDSVSLTYPAKDTPFSPEHGWQCSFGTGNSGLDAAGHWYLPQGFYRICMQQQMSEGAWQHQYRTIAISQAAGRTWNGNEHCAAEWNGLVTDGSLPLPTAGQCGCIPEPDVPVGTGDVQVTLQWFNELSIDVDLWVYDPFEERCYYGNTTTESGGRLDRDNLCSNYQNGMPENVFWATAPAGEYSIWVDWYSDCSHGMQNQPFNVRLVNHEQVVTWDRVLQRDQSLELAQFTVFGGQITLYPPGGLFVAEPPRREQRVEKRVDD